MANQCFVIGIAGGSGSGKSTLAGLLAERLSDQKVTVIGGGAAGMMAAITAAEAGASVTLLEKNEKLGKKLYITGKGRCNLTNTCELPAFFDNIPRGNKFLYKFQ